MNQPSFSLSQLKLESIAPPANKAQIIELENHFDHPIPINLKEIFRNYNGSRITLNQSDEMGHFYTLGKDKKNSFNIWHVINQYKDVLGPETLPFAEQRTQAIYFLKWEQHQTKVYLLHPDKESELISDSFDEFLGRLLAINIE